jgi:DNA replication licensing factor MCM6
VFSAPPSLSHPRTHTPQKKQHTLSTQAWSLIKEESTFVDWQRARVQEAADEVPPGCLPRTMEVILRNDAVEAARPGDQAVFTGSLVAVPDVAAITAPGERTEARQGGLPGAAGGDGGITGPRFLGVRELTYHLAFVASGVEDATARRAGGGSGGTAAGTAAALGGAGGGATEETPASVLASLTGAEAADLALMRANPRLYADAARSIAPGVLGADDIKRSVLLQLVGGVPKVTPDGIRLRGDINVAIVGDPSMAKSQVLKYVAGFLPHAVYTSGRASSAAGLTASVVREADSGELCIEAGALLLANGAVCCIDEFDKMDVKV